MSEETVVSTKNVFQVLKDRVEELKVYHKMPMNTLVQGGVIVSKQSNIPQGATPGRFIQVAESTLKNIQPNECKIIFRVMMGLRFNNPLWYCDNAGQSQVKLALLSLQRKSIITNIQRSKGIYIVNPQYIRKGAAVQIYPSLIQHIHESMQKNRKWVISTDDIINLRFQEYDTRFPNM